jgi:hypothetical protein
MPSGASIQKVIDHMCVIKHDISLHLLIELVGKIDSSLVRISWTLPLATNLARGADFGNHVQHSIRNTNSFQESLHLAGTGVPPANM